MNEEQIKEIPVGLSDEQIELLDRDILEYLDYKGIADVFNLETGDSFFSLKKTIANFQNNQTFSQLKQFEPNWDDAPEWANWLAQDEKYTWTWYAIEPKEGMGYFASNGYNQNIIFKNPVWKETLQERPKPTPFVAVEVGQVWKDEDYNFIVIGVNNYVVAYQDNETGDFGTYGLDDLLANFERSQNIIGVELSETGKNGGVWNHIDADGNILATQLGTSNFNEHPAWGGMTDITIDGQAMVKVPKFYFKRGTSATGKDAWWISDAPVAGFSVHPAFMNVGSEVAQFYYGKYQARFDGTKMTSLSGGLPQTSRTPVQFSADAAARNTAGVTGFMMHSFWQLSAIQMLYLIENKTMDSQTKTGSGVTGSLGNVENGSANYRNIIGLWENAAQWLDGFKTLNGDIKTWDINGNKTWISQGVAPTVDGSWHYPITFKSNNNLNAAFIEATDTVTATSGTSADGHLFYNGVTTTEYIPVVGGIFGYGAAAGLWCMDCNDVASSSSGNYGSRLAKV